MPFGYVNSPSVYQRGIDKAVGELKGKQALIYNYIDDVIIPFKTDRRRISTFRKGVEGFVFSELPSKLPKVHFYHHRDLGAVISAGTVRRSAR
jgi:hypothetical protein